MTPTPSLSSSPAAGTADAPRSWADAVARLAPSVIAVVAQRRHAAAGFIWQDRLAIVSASAVGRRKRVEVVLADAEPVTAEMRGMDPATDLAVLALPEGAAPAVRRADDTLPRVGDPVCAVGREGSGLLHASFGHIGAAGDGWRSWGGGRVDRLIRLDGGLYAGLHGAPVAGPDGRVIGLGSGAFSRQHGVVVPVGTIERVVAQLLAHGRVPRGHLGLAAQRVMLPEALRAAMDVPHDAGLLVHAVADDGPAAKAGLTVGDIIVSAAGQAVPSVGALRELLNQQPVGGQLVLRLARGGAPVTLEVPVAERPPEAEVE